MDELTDIYNYLPLTDTLLTSGQPTKSQFTAVAAAGVETVINLALTTSANALSDEKEIVNHLGMDYIHIPVIWEEPHPEELEQFMDAMDRLAGHKTLVHCAANMRVSTFVALYRILRLGWDQELAFKDTRRIWDPSQDDIWRNFIASVLESKR